MQTFRTVISPPQSDFKISHRDHCLLVGSCFTENIGERLADLKFPNFINPNGIVYNPISIGFSIKNLLLDNDFDTNSLFQNQGLWHSPQHHGKFSKIEKTATQTVILSSQNEAKKFLKKTNRLFLTLGTANVFEWKKTGEIVANCHKLPAAEFSKRRISVAETVDALLPILEKMKTQTPDFQAVLTVSPVRHLRDGFVENQWSKSVLLLACDEICRAAPFSNYFPAYEILLDDLRDYRFFEADMVHPNDVAIQYLWQIFGETYFSEETKKINQQLEKINAAAAHRPFNLDSVEHRNFIEKQTISIEKFKKDYPFIEWRGEFI